MILGCCEPFQSTAEDFGRHQMHHKLMKQTQHKFQTVFIKYCLQINILIAILTRLHADGSGRRQDPPGLAAAVHHIPYQLIARLVCQSGRAKVYRLQLLAHAHQQSASDVQIHHQQPAYTSTKHARILAVNIFFFMTIKKERRTLIAFRSRCLNRHSLASAWLI